MLDTTGYYPQTKIYPLQEGFGQCCSPSLHSKPIQRAISSIIIPHVKIVSRDWLTKVGHSIMFTGKTSTGSTGSHCCIHWYFTKLVFFRYNKTNMPCQCGYPDGMSPLGRMVFPRAPPSGKPSSLWETFHQDTHTGMAYLYKKCPGRAQSCEHYCSLRAL